MPEKFIVPQFIENEDKILGPITVRQFLLCLITVFLLFIEYKLFAFAYFIMAAILTAGIGGTFAFLKINGQPFHIFFLNFVQTALRPNLRLWNREPNEADLRESLKPKVQKLAPPTIAKKLPHSTRLRELALTVNTGGVYQPDEEE
ncbi:MAG: PrgI family protein [Patescibacteria group bacterium]|nr:PrgI family protein [Patescibacteria group bacterium]MBU2509616.1 PrgI family protein [Patescibacteria group bacterium]